MYHTNALCGLAASLRSISTLWPSAGAVHCVLLILVQLSAQPLGVQFLCSVFACASSDFRAASRGVVSLLNFDCAS